MRRTTGALAVAAVVALAGCSSSTYSSPKAANPTPSAPAAAATTPPAATGTPVTVTETDFKLALSTKAFTAGSYTFTVKNSGGTTHALAVDGPGVSDMESSRVSPGESTTLTVTLSKGTYQLFCPVGGHKDLGMQTTITVT